MTLPGQATGTNGELLALSGTRNPYPGVLGRIVKGAWADLLIADGDPAANLDFLADPEKNLHLIMKDGKIRKNTLQSRRAGSLPAPFRGSGVVFTASDSGF